MQSRLSLAVFAALGVLVPAGSARATIMLPLSIEQLATESAAIVRAEVVGRRAAWSADKRHIFTYTELRVAETLAGAAKPGAVLTVRTLGGEVGETGMKVAGVARFTPGEEVVVFLRTDPVDARDFQVVGMSQGKYKVKRVDGRAVLEPGVEGLAFAARRADGALTVDPSHPGPGQISLEALRSRVAAARAAPATGSVLPTEAPSGPGLGTTTQP